MYTARSTQPWQLAPFLPLKSQFSFFSRFSPSFPATPQHGSPTSTLTCSPALKNPSTQQNCLFFLPSSYHGTALKRPSFLFQVPWIFHVSTESPLFSAYLNTRHSLCQKLSRRDSSQFISKDTRCSLLEPPAREMWITDDKWSADNCRRQFSPHSSNRNLVKKEILMSAKLLFCCWKKSHEWLNQESAHNVAARRKSQPPAPSNRGPDCCSFPYIHGTATKYNYSDGQIWPKYSWSVQISFLNRQLQKRTQRKPDWPTRLAGNTQK